MRACSSLLLPGLFLGATVIACASAAPPPEGNPEGPASTEPPAAAPMPTVEPPAPVASAAPSAVPSAAPEPAPPAEPPPLPKDTTVLHVGDSMADALGSKLSPMLRELGIKAPLEAKEATYIPQWAGFKMKFQQHLGYHEPDLVIVTLGGNETAMPTPADRIEPIKRMVKQIGDTPCIWIAAPLWPGAKHSGILDVIRENCAPCIYVDTNELIEPKMKVLGDGIHPTIPERRRWARYMINWLRAARDPNGPKPWSLKKEEDIVAPPSEPPPPESKK